MPAEIKTLCEGYEKRLRKYGSCEFLVLPDVKNAGSLPVQELKKKEWALFSSKMGKGAKLVLLDEKGKSLTSVEFAGFIRQQRLQSVKELVFLMGGAFGFDDEAYKTADASISLSPMTFSHQLARLVFAEQLYRAFTIIHGEKYHHS